MSLHVQRIHGNQHAVRMYSGHLFRVRLELKLLECLRQHSNRESIGYSNLASPRLCGSSNPAAISQLHVVLIDEFCNSATPPTLALGVSGTTTWCRLYATACCGRRLHAFDRTAQLQFHDCHEMRLYEGSCQHLPSWSREMGS